MPHMDPHGALRSSMYITNPNLEDANIANVKRHMLVGRNLGHYTFSRLVSEYPRHPTTIASIWLELCTEQLIIPVTKCQTNPWWKTANRRRKTLCIQHHLRPPENLFRWSSLIKGSNHRIWSFFWSERRWKTPTMVSGAACLARGLALPTMPRMNHAGVRVGCYSLEWASCYIITKKQQKYVSMNFWDAWFFSELGAASTRLISYWKNDQPTCGVSEETAMNIFTSHPLKWTHQQYTKHSRCLSFRWKMMKGLYQTPNLPTWRRRRLTLPSHEMSWDILKPNCHTNNRWSPYPSSARSSLILSCSI